MQRAFDCPGAHGALPEAEPKQEATLPGSGKAASDRRKATRPDTNDAAMPADVAVPCEPGAGEPGLREPGLREPGVREPGRGRTMMQIAAERLRQVVLASADGAFLGREDDLLHRLECSRATLRQVARLLEREGLLEVRRGSNGGYFGKRPDAGTIEATVGAHLQTLDVDIVDTFVIASALWVETMRKATRAPEDERMQTAARLGRKLAEMGADAAFEELRELEFLVREEVFALARSDYIRLIFDINAAYAWQWLGTRHKRPVTDARFVRAWGDAKQMELFAIACGDADLAVMAANHSRKLWQDRLKTDDGALANGGDHPAGDGQP